MHAEAVGSCYDILRLPQSGHDHASPSALLQRGDGRVAPIGFLRERYQRQPRIRAQLGVVPVADSRYNFLESAAADPYIPAQYQQASMSRVKSWRRGTDIEGDMSAHVPAPISQAMAIVVLVGRESKVRRGGKDGSHLLKTFVSRVLSKAYGPRHQLSARGRSDA